MAPNDNLRLCESFLHYERVRSGTAADGGAARAGSLGYQLPAERERAVNGGAGTKGGAGASAQNQMGQSAGAQFSHKEVLLYFENTRKCNYVKNMLDHTKKTFKQ